MRWRFVLTNRVRESENSYLIRLLNIVITMGLQAGYDDYLIHLFNREDNMVSLKEALEEHKVSQLYEPGFASCYSNYGAGLAGYVVENVVGEPLYQYVEEEILEPLGMEHTRMKPELDEDIKVQKSKAYKVQGNGLSEGNWSYVSMYPAGSINGTLDDLAKFAIAYLEKNPVFWHNGGTENFSTFFAIVPEADFAIMACGNTEEAIEMTQPFCFSMLQKREVQLEKPQENLPDIAMLTGDYQDYREEHKGILLSVIKTRKIREKGSQFYSVFSMTLLLLLCFAVVWKLV